MILKKGIVEVILIEVQGIKKKGEVQLFPISEKICIMLQSLDSFDILPVDMRNYLRHYGRHFSKNMLQFAVSTLRDKYNNKIEPKEQTQLDSLLSTYGIEIQNNILYDALYVYHMALSDFYGSSLQTEQQLALFIKDYVDDSDQAEGFIFNRFYADCVRKGISISWDRCL